MNPPQSTHPSYINASRTWPPTSSPLCPQPTESSPSRNKPTIALGVDFDVSRQHKALCDGGLHLDDDVCDGFVDVHRAVVTAVHDEGAVVHAALQDSDEVLVEGLACSGRVDVGVGREDGEEVFPFAGVAGMDVVSFWWEVWGMGDK